MGCARDSDLIPSAATVARVVDEQFPSLGGLPVRSFGAGSDNVVFAVGDDWLMRFAKRRGRVAWLEREGRVCELAAGELGALVPRFELRGRPSAAYPHPFFGYRRLPGVAADAVELHRSGEAGAAVRGKVLAADLGRALTRLHAIPATKLPPAPAATVTDSWAALRAQLVTRASTVRPLLDPEARAIAEPHLSGDAATPERDGPSRVVHNDICPDHVLADPTTGELRGLIDLCDAVVGDPIVDLVGLIGLGGYGFIADVLAAYDQPLGGHVAPALVWLARTLTLIWLADAAELDPGDMRKHQRWVAYALESPGGRL